ncbi:MAG: hypothetical protein HYZ53_20685 [Planctomycetes bacterium]|nr:hypothetical protein [Planctomycetota bacterium]
MPVLWQHVEARRAFERWVPKGMGAAETADALADALRRHGSTLAREVTRQVEAVIERAGPSLAAAAAAGPLSSLPAAVAAAGGTSQPYAAPPPMPTSRQVRRIPIDDIQGIIDMLNESQLRGSAQN